MLLQQGTCVKWRERGSWDRSLRSMRSNRWNPMHGIARSNVVGGSPKDAAIFVKREAATLARLIQFGKIRPE